RPGTPITVLLGHGVWKTRYGSDRSVLGRTIKVNDIPCTIIGVMPEGFKFPQNADMWQPFSAMADLESQKRSARRFEIMGRLATGASRTSAQAELIGIGAR